MLTAIAGLNICATTVKKVLESDGIRRRKPTKKPLPSAEQKAARLEFCLKYRYLNWQNVIFTDESYFETGNLRSRRARGVLRCLGEAYLPRNINRKFPKGATVMFWGAILYGYSGILIIFYYKVLYKLI